MPRGPGRRGGAVSSAGGMHGRCGPASSAARAARSRRIAAVGRRGHPSSAPDLKVRLPSLLSASAGLVDLGPLAAGSGAGGVHPKLVVWVEPGGNPCLVFSSTAAAAPFGVVLLPGVAVVGSSPHPGQGSRAKARIPVGWAAAAPGASCPSWRRRLGKIGALGLRAAAGRWAAGVHRVPVAR